MKDLRRDGGEMGDLVKGLTNPVWACLQSSNQQLVSLIGIIYERNHSLWFRILSRQRATMQQFVNKRYSEKEPGVVGQIVKLLMHHTLIARALVLIRLKRGQHPLSFLFPPLKPRSSQGFVQVADNPCFPNSHDAAPSLRKLLQQKRKVPCSEAKVMARRGGASAGLGHEAGARGDAAEDGAVHGVLVP